jgi:hypothetical protein
MMWQAGFLAVALVLGAGAASAEEGFAPIFDGKTLEGWEGKEGFWSVQDGAITGKTTEDKPLDKNTFLIWRKAKVADFELRFKIRLVNGNTGLQYRSKEIEPFVIAGYQADFDAAGEWIGVLYDERGRALLAKRGTKVVIHKDGKNEVVGETTPEKKILDSIKKEDWNDYTIVAKGNHLVQTINGLTTIDVTDEELAEERKEGILALQLHTGPPMIVQIKDVQLKKFE